MCRRLRQLMKCVLIAVLLSWPSNYAEATERIIGVELTGEDSVRLVFASGKAESVKVGPECGRPLLAQDGLSWACMRRAVGPRDMLLGVSIVVFSGVAKRREIRPEDPYFVDDFYLDTDGSGILAALREFQGYTKFCRFDLKNSREPDCCSTPYGGAPCALEAEFNRLQQRAKP